jgi:SAM-dependent methyltransferase
MTEKASERMTITMSSQGMRWVWVVVCLGLVGCASEKPASQKATGTEAGATKPAASTAGQAASQTPPAVAETPEPKRPDVIFVPTPPEVVDKMLELAQVTKDDVVYDLGCGDGRIVVAAAKKYGCKAFGFDVDPERIQESKENVEKNGVGNLVTIEQKDIFTLDLSKASVITLYLLPDLNVKLIPQLEKLKPGSRIVSHDFDMRGVTPDKVITVDEDSGYGPRVYLWTTPLKKEAETN